MITPGGRSRSEDCILAGEGSANLSDLTKWLERRFSLRAARTDARTELIAGLTTFMTMAYIVFVNPRILAAAGVPFEPAIAGTALAACLSTLLIGLMSNFPLTMAAGMGINAALAFGMVKGAGMSWQTAMGVIVWEGVVVTLLVLTNVREQVFDAIPLSLKKGIAVGIGLFLAFIGMSQADFVVSSAATKVTYNPGLVRDPVALVAVFGLVVTIALMIRKTRGAILVGIVASTLLAIGLDAVAHTRVLGRGALARAAHVVAMPHFSTAFHADLKGALSLVGLSWVFAMVMTDFFDTMGTVVAVGREAGFADEKGRVPRLKWILLADSIGAVIGGVMGVSSNTTYIESASGAAAGGRTGLSSVVVAGCFLLAVFFSPVIGLVPEAATAPALILVGFLMLGGVTEMDFGKLDEAVPAVITMLAIPLTYSIAHGIGYGMVLYVVLKLLSGKAKDVKPAMWIVAVAFFASWFVDK